MEIFDLSDNIGKLDIVLKGGTSAKDKEFLSLIRELITMLQLKNLAEHLSGHVSVFDSNYYLWWCLPDRNDELKRALFVEMSPKTGEIVLSYSFRNSRIFREDRFKFSLKPENFVKETVRHIERIKRGYLRRIKGGVL
jgi:hypothetical protein